jgi:hypothetical protein
VQAQGAAIVRQWLRLTTLVAFLACGLAFAGSKLSSDIQQVGGNKTIDVIVQFNRVPTDADVMQFASSQVKRRFQHVKALHLSLTPDQIRALAANPRVTYISPDRAISGSLDVTSQTVGANIAWQSGWNGTGIGVGRSR